MIAVASLRANSPSRSAGTCRRGFTAVNAALRCWFLVSQVYRSSSSMPASRANHWTARLGSEIGS